MVQSGERLGPEFSKRPKTATGRLRRPLAEPRRGISKSPERAWPLPISIFPTPPPPSAGHHPRNRQRATGPKRIWKREMGSRNGDDIRIVNSVNRLSRPGSVIRSTPLSSRGLTPKFC
jgi:hypothetical protein